MARVLSILEGAAAGRLACKGPSVGGSVSWPVMGFSNDCSYALFVVSSFSYFHSSSPAPPRRFVHAHATLNSDKIQVVGNLAAETQEQAQLPEVM